MFLLKSTGTPVLSVGIGLHLYTLVGCTALMVVAYLSSLGILR
jgi:hypothetical protein